MSKKGLNNITLPAYKEALKEMSKNGVSYNITDGTTYEELPEYFPDVIDKLKVGDKIILDDCVFFVVYSSEDSRYLTGISSSTGYPQLIYFGYSNSDEGWDIDESTILTPIPLDEDRDIQYRFTYRFEFLNIDTNDTGLQLYCTPFEIHSNFNLIGSTITSQALEDIVKNGSSECFIGSDSGDLYLCQLQMYSGQLSVKLLNDGTYDQFSIAEYTCRRLDKYTFKEKVYEV